MSLPQSWISSSNTGQIGSAYVSFAAQAGQNLIQPGSRLTGFTVSSKHKPGFALAFSQGPPVSDFSLEGLPLPVVEQLKPFQALERDSQAQWVIVPLYHPETNFPAMIGDFYGGIEAYIHHQRLDPASPFIQELLSVLRKYRDAAEAAGDTPVDEFVGPSLELKQKPTLGLESEIYGALKLSLDLK